MTASDVEWGDSPRDISLAALERETIVNGSDGDDLIRIWTAQRRHITRLRRNEAFTEVASGQHGTTEWAEFTIPARDWSPASGAKRKRRALSDEERAELSERLKRVREAR